MILAETLKQYIAGKRIIMVGAALDLTRRTGAQIDRHDVVVRFNHQYPRAEHAGSMGLRCDIWACCLLHRTAQLQNLPHYECAGLKYVLRLRWRNRPETLAEELLDRTYLPDDQELRFAELRAAVGPHPSCGALAFHMFRRCIPAYAVLHVIGFDFLRTRNRVLKSNASYGVRGGERVAGSLKSPHYPDREEAYFSQWRDDHFAGSTDQV